MQNRALASPDPLQVPPTAPIAREDEVSRRAPLRLPDRLASVRTRDVGDIAELAVGAQMCDAELAAVPRHPREIPGEKAEPRSVGRHARIRVEVPAARDYTWLEGAVGRKRDELVDDVRRAAARWVSLANADPHRPVSRYPTVGVAMHLVLDGR